MIPSSQNHPPSIDLEAFACGEENAEIAAHVASCDSCKAFTTEIETASRAFAEETDFDAIIGRAAALVESKEPGQSERPTPKVTPIAAAKVTRLDTALRVVPFLAMAAGVLLWMKLSGGPETTGGAQAQNVTPPVQTGQINTDTTGTAFKGGTQLAVIRERNGEQKRFTGEVSVRKGDRLRIEVALDHSANILGGVLAEDGTFLDLLHEGERGTGTFYSEEAARFDDSPTRGYVVVGPRDSVQHATTAIVHPAGKGPFDEGTAVMRLTWEGP